MQLLSSARTNSNLRNIRSWLTPGGVTASDTTTLDATSGCELCSSGGRSLRKAATTYVPPGRTSFAGIWRTSFEQPLMKTMNMRQAASACDVTGRAKGIATILPDKASVRNGSKAATSYSLNKRPLTAGPSRLAMTAKGAQLPFGHPRQPMLCETGFDSPHPSYSSGGARWVMICPDRIGSSRSASADAQRCHSSSLA